MKGVRVCVHQSSRRSDRRKLFSITRSPSVAVVSEMAPMWMTASSLRASSQAASSAGGTRSAIWRLARLRHLASSRPSVSLTTMSVAPASLRLATTFDPMKPAPPVTKNILPLAGAVGPRGPSFAPVRGAAQRACQSPVNGSAGVKFCGWTGTAGAG